MFWNDRRRDQLAVEWKYIVFNRNVKNVASFWFPTWFLTIILWLHLLEYAFAEQTTAVSNNIVRVKSIVIFLDNGNAFLIFLRDSEKQKPEKK